MIFRRKRERLTDYEQRVINDVQEYGWYCSAVFDPDGDDPNFAYSVGFTSTLNAPEFIVFGLDLKLMHSMLWEVFRQIDAGKAVVDGDRWSGLLEGFDCVARAVHADNVVREYLNSAIWYWRRGGNDRSPPVYQIAWPGAQDGLFPWDQGCAAIVQKLQPPLWSQPEHAQ